MMLFIFALAGCSYAQPSTPNPSKINTAVQQNTDQAMQKKTGILAANLEDTDAATLQMDDGTTILLINQNPGISFADFAGKKVTVEGAMEKDQFDVSNIMPAQSESSEPLSYSLNGVSASVSKTSAPFAYTSEQLKNMADECGSKHASGYFDQLISKFKGTTKRIYSFKYTGASQVPDTYLVSLLPNKAGYTSLNQFKKDFDMCAAGGTYPTMLNSNWLLFTSSCGSGYADESGRPIGCEKVQKVVEPTLKLN